MSQMLKKIKDQQLDVYRWGQPSIFFDEFVDVKKEDNMSTEERLRKAKLEVEELERTLEEENTPIPTVNLVIDIDVMDEGFLCDVEVNDCDEKEFAVSTKAQLIKKVIKLLEEKL